MYKEFIKKEFKRIFGKEKKFCKFELYQTCASGSLDIPFYVLKCRNCGFIPFSFNTKEYWEKRLTKLNNIVCYLQ